MGVLPLTFKDGTTRKSLRLDGSERFDLMGLGNGLKPGMAVPCRITRGDGKSRTIELLCRIDTEDEVEYYRHGGILHYVLRNLLTAAA
jgi:aconitate hydratase